MMSRSQRSRAGVGGLLAVNGALLVALALVTFGSSAFAQGFRAKGVYHAVSGNAPGSESGVVYVADEANELMIALTFDPNTKTLQLVGKRDLAADVAQFGRARN